MKIWEITFSPTGGTQKCTDLLLSEFQGKIEKIDLVKQKFSGETFTFAKEDVCFFAVPSYAGRVPHIATERILSFNGNGAKAILVCVYGNRAYEDTLLELKNTVKEAGFFPIVAVACIAEHSIVRQYASKRPDQSDQRALKSFSALILENLGSTKEVQVPGNFPYKEGGGHAMPIEISHQCDDCHKCAMTCPVNAISKENIRNTDANLCIGCMRCVAVCPKQARSLNKETLNQLSVKLENAMKVRKENEILIG